MLMTDYNFATGETIKREASAEELESFNIVSDDEAMRRQAESSKAQAKSALLQRLGITAEEAALLLS